MEFNMATIAEVRPAHQLRFNPKRKVTTHRLPFVGGRQTGYGISFWHVPATGGYSGGCQTGEALAGIYLKHLRDHGGEQFGALQRIALSMFDCDLTASRHGQVVGFFARLDAWLVAAAKTMGESLDAVSNDALLSKANDGINLDEAAYLASLGLNEE
ncbi:hypothetical protein LH425_06650 [Laribacter hongkongensis]|uniref:hypothetical protein n=1 Tax=Laribacter hongkongensis TaxID=168471 RepID=UPI001EFCEEC8|nr:hypothetical protein [Laribacter hongkongensis]MCG9064723.1 hypothetical protein [Laribacter hongkongensis]